MTVQDLINTLRMFPRDAQVRILKGPGDLIGVQSVINLAGRVTIRPVAEEQAR